MVNLGLRYQLNLTSIQMHKGRIKNSMNVLYITLTVEANIVELNPTHGTYALFISAL